MGAGVGLRLSAAAEQEVEQGHLSRMSQDKLDLGTDVYLNSNPRLVKEPVESRFLEILNECVTEDSLLTTDNNPRSLHRRSGRLRLPIHFGFTSLITPLNSPMHSRS